MKNLLLLLILITTVCSAQDRGFNASQSSNAFSNNLNVFAMQKIDKIYNGVLSGSSNGSVYLFKEFEECIIYHNSKDSYYKANANYNVYSDQFEVLIDNELYLLDQKSVKEIQQGDRVFLPNPSEKQQKKYMEIIAEGKNISLVIVYEARVFEAQTQTLGLVENKIKLVNKDYFILDNELVKVPNSNSKILKLLKLTEQQKKKFGGENLKNLDTLISLIKNI